MAKKFKRIAKLAQDYFGREMGYDFFRINVDESYDRTGHKHIGVVGCDCGHTPTKIFYNPAAKSAVIKTFHQKPTTEEGFAELLGNMGIEAKVEVVGIPSPAGRPALFYGLGAHSPSGRVDAEEVDAMM